MLKQFVKYLVLFLLLSPLTGRASFSIKTPSDEGYNVPTNRPSIRTIDFTNVTLEQERLASRITHSKINRVKYDAAMSFPGFSGNTVDIDSTPTNDGDPGSQLIVNFLGGGSKEVSFLWGLNVIDQDSFGIIIRLSNGSHKTLTNCRDNSFEGCVSYYLGSSVIDDLINFFYEMVGVVRYKPVYVRFVAPPDLRVTRISFVSFNVEENAGSLWTGSPAAQSFHLDNLSYVDATARPDHIQILAESANVGRELPFNLKVKTCFNAQCSEYTAGVSGRLNIIGTSSVATIDENGAFFIQPGSSETDISAALTGSGTAAVSLSELDPTVEKVYCGFGQAATSTSSCNLNIVNVLHHVEVVSSSSEGLTCTPAQFTIRACSNASCTVRNTSGLSGTFSVAGVTSNYPQGQSFTIEQGQSELTLPVNLTTPGTATVSLSGLSVIPSNGVYCGLGQNAAAGGSCNMQIADAGFLITAANEYSGKSQNMTIAAVKKSNLSSSCVPAFSNTQKSVSVKCSYGNPSTGSKSAVIGGVALNSSNNKDSSCSPAGVSIPLSFNAQGIANVPLVYPDAGQIRLDVRYIPSAEESGLNLEGVISMAFAPYSLDVQANANSGYIAGDYFSASIVAKNFQDELTPNFGKESTPLDFKVEFIKREPMGTNSSEGSFSRIQDPTMFNKNTMTINGLRWSEVGSGDLKISVNNPGGYLGSGLEVEGSTGEAGAVGPFKPSHFEVSVSEQGCGTFTYSGQPFGVVVTAKNKQNEIVVNYDGTSLTYPNMAKNINFESSNQQGVLNGFIYKGDFVKGQAIISSSKSGAPSFTLNNKETAPLSVAFKVIDEQLVESSSTAAVDIKSGRLRLFNAYGNSSVLKLGVQAQYWSGKSWVLNGQDSCTQIPMQSVAFSQYLDSKGAPSPSFPLSAQSLVLSSGQGLLEIASQNATQYGTVSVAINLGRDTVDNSCLDERSPSSGANSPWLRYQHGAGCPLEGDPFAKATFGIYKGENKNPIIYQEDLF